MNAGNTTYAGWAAMAAAILMVPEALLMLQYDAGRSAGAQALVPIALLMAMRTALAAWAMLSLRLLLRERLDYHAADRLILWLVVGSFVLAAAAVIARIPVAAAEPLFVVALLLTAGLAVGVLSFSFGLRLLSLPANLGGYRKAFAWMHLLAPVCFLTVILAPVGLLMLMAALVLLGLILLKGEETVPEFV